jgi:hypothetical protein
MNAQQLNYAVITMVHSAVYSTASICISYIHGHGDALQLLNIRIHMQMYLRRSLSYVCSLLIMLHVRRLVPIHVWLLEAVHRDSVAVATRSQHEP